MRTSPKILLLGASGQVGTHTRRLFESTLVRDGDYQLLAPSHRELDITDKEQVQKYLDAHSPSIIINCTAYTNVDAAEDSEDLAFLVNHIGVQNLSQAAKPETLILHLSTDYVFDGSAKRPISEATPPSPINVYGRSKLAGENALLQHHEASIILRTSWVYSATHPCFVRTMLNLGQTHDELSIVNDQFGCPTFSGNLANALLGISRKFLENQGTPFGVYHFSDLPETNWHDFAKEIFAIQKSINGQSPIIKPVTSDHYITKAKRPKYSVLDSSKICKTFGIEQISWQTQLPEIVKELGRETE